LKGHAAKGGAPRRRLPSGRAPFPEDGRGEDVDELNRRILELEGRIRALSVSRRVLISLLVSADRKRKLEVARLEVEVKKLRSRHAKSARAVAIRDVAIHRLRFRLDALFEQPEDRSDPNPLSGPRPVVRGQAGLAVPARENLL
jgi:hypothetical protein